MVLVVDHRLIGRFVRRTATGELRRQVTRSIGNMSAVYWPQILAITAAVALNYWFTWWRRERAIARAEAGYNAAFDLDTAQPQLERYFAILQDVLPSRVKSAPAVRELPVVWDSPIVRARSAVAFAAERFGLSLPPVEVVITPHIADGREAELVWDEPWEIVLDGERCVLRPLEGAFRNWRIRFREEVMNDLERLCVVAAHEVAHVLLFARGLRLSPDKQNEELTDAAVVLAGFGPIMERAAYSVVRHPPRRGAFTYSVSRSGYLHRKAIQFLHERRAILSAPDAPRPKARPAVT